ncbi:leucine-rich repeats and immunoglobulin-like domains protein 1 [Mytilus californianus]|uniref:leucine-rich repeats and immunoglobulin-like domains protein 1 n=1 Tax=Mytilus californianus TaxID=6549 RepID=UPI0022453AE7|nr:leucine-rich repeats and immunoglobulin-like domains protein 1 [Mytilus californianus]
MENLDSVSTIKDSSNIMDIKHEPVTFVEGENVTFNCSGDVGRPPGIFLWQAILHEKQMPLFSNTSLNEIPQLCSYNGISVLNLQVTAEDNQARIRCKVQSGVSDDALYVESERLNVYFKVKDPVIIVYPDELIYEIGELIKLQCKASGNPAPTYTWIKDSSSNETLSSNNTFVIQEANISDSDLYTCLVNNSINDIVYSAKGSKYIEIVKYRWIYGKSAKLAVLITVISSSIMLIVATGCIIIYRLKTSQGNKYLDTVRPQNQTLTKPEILAYEYAAVSFEGLEESRVTLEASNTFKQQTEKYKNDK